MLNMLQTIISSLPMNTTNINNLDANSMIIKNLSLEKLVIELVPAYWLVVILALTAISLFLGTISTFLSFLIQFLIQSIIACLCFWTEKASSIERLLFIPTLFLSGLLAPVVSFPEYVKSWIY